MIGTNNAFRQFSSASAAAASAATAAGPARLTSTPLSAISIPRFIRLDTAKGSRIYRVPAKGGGRQGRGGGGGGVRGDTTWVSTSKNFTEGAVLNVYTQAPYRVHLTTHGPSTPHAVYRSPELKMPQFGRKHTGGAKQDNKTCSVMFPPSATCGSNRIMYEFT